MDKSKIRNFLIIVYIDYGKSIFVDRILELINIVVVRDLEE